MLAGKRNPEKKALRLSKNLNLIKKKGSEGAAEKKANDL